MSFRYIPWFEAKCMFNNKPIAAIGFDVLLEQDTRVDENDNDDPYFIEVECPYCKGKIGEGIHSYGVTSNGSLRTIAY